MKEPDASTCFQYFPRSTGVLPKKYWSTAKEVLKTIKVKNYRRLGK